MIPHRNLDAPDAKDILMTDANRELIRTAIDRELGSFFYACIWRGQMEQPIIDFLTDTLVQELGLKASECESTAQRLGQEVIDETVEEANQVIPYYKESFPWKVVEKCLKDYKFSDIEMGGARNKISQFLPEHIDDPFLKVEIPLVIMFVMDLVATHEKNIGRKRKIERNIDAQKLIDYTLIDFKMNRSSLSLFPYLHHV